MERATPVRKPHTNTADLLSWSEVPPANNSSASSVASGNASRSSARSHQPSDGISKTLFGGQITDEEAESLNKRSGNTFSFLPFPLFNVPVMVCCPSLLGCSGFWFTNYTRDKSGQMSLFRVFLFLVPVIKWVAWLAPSTSNQEVVSSSHPKSKVPAGGQSNILFGDEPVVNTVKKIHDQKFAELTGNDIFKGDVPPGSAEKPLSRAKLREMNGNDIFSDGKVESRDYFGGVRKPPGGESSIALI
uniref:DUF4057 domain-containing protein n=1 Tax=Nicotiana tabacum TaxID=4097 RepID=A0A1S4C6G9_TOBAC|nr:PREDICTED: uncharacterized protein LOC107815717 [Nicotiana tabacum]